MSKIKKALRVFVDFLGFGCFTFGGGWSIIAQMTHTFVEKKKEMTREELLDLTGVAQSLPGAMITNVAMLYGYRVAGFLGGVLAILGMILPPMIILTVITYFYTVLEGNVWMMAIMKGIRAAVVPIIISAVWGVSKGSFKYPPCFLVTIICIALYIFLKVNCIWLIVIGIISGFIITEIYEKRGDKNA